MTHTPIQRLSRWTRKLAAMAGLMALAAGAGAQAQTTAVTVAHTPSNAFLPIFVAKEQGFFEKNGLDVTPRMIPVISTLPAALESNSVQIAPLALPGLLMANSGGLDLVVIAGGVLQHKENPSGGLLANKSLTIEKPADLVGKRVAVPGINSYLHITALRWLADAGVDPRGVTFVEMAFPQMGDQLRSGQIDAAISVEPFMGRILGSDAGKLVSKITGEGDAHFDVAYVVTRAFADKHPQLPKAFRASIEEAMAWIAANEAQARTYQIKYLKQPEEVARTIPLPTYRTDLTERDIVWWSEVMNKLGLMKQPAKTDIVIE